MAAALINEIPPISIFSMIVASPLLMFCNSLRERASASAHSFTVFSKGYRSTITKSISGISNFVSCSTSLTSFLRLKIPPKIFGCKVFTLPPKIEGYKVRSSTGTTGISICSIKVCVPPVAYNVTPRACKASITGAKPSLW